MTTQEVIDKYFKNDGRELLYFHGSDKMQMYQGECYLRIEKTGTVDLWMGSDNGEQCLLTTHDGDKLESLIRILIY